MFAHATSSHPNGYRWYQQPNGHYVCTSQPPIAGQSYSSCNRVERLPLFAYLTDYQYGSYWHMHDPSVLGIHIEKIVTAPES
jgi:hypothetical protein